MHSQGAIAVMSFVIPALIALVINEAVTSTFNIKELSVMAIVIAVAAACRPLGVGIAGIEPIWIVIIIAGAAFGAIPGFIIGTTALVTSAVMTSGIGPWLPYQMLLAGWIGYGAGLVTIRETRRHVIGLASYGAIATFFFGWLMNLWFWPTASTLNASVAFNPAAAVSDRIAAWAHFSLVTSLGIDLPRALLTFVGVIMAAPPLLRSMRRAFRPANTSTDISSRATSSKG
jgi:energy-coupling factor transport system substrate-specific component